MWMWTGHRQTAKLRNLYLSAVLRQDVAFFDTQATTGSLLKGLDEDSASVQQAISEKVGHFMQHVSCFLIGYIVAFWRGEWRCMGPACSGCRQACCATAGSAWVWPSMLCPTGLQCWLPPLQPGTCLQVQTVQLHHAQQPFS